MGDTIADILEGVNAKGAYSVGVILGSNENGTYRSRNKINACLRTRSCIADVKERMLAAGASYVIRTIEIVLRNVD